jgi:hypothetical protein
MHDMIIQPCIVFVAALSTWLASLWAKGQRSGPSLSEPSWVPGGACRLKASIFRSEQIGAEPVLVVVLHGGAPFHAALLVSCHGRPLGKISSGWLDGL